MVQLVAGLLALVLLATSGSFGGVAHLCLMNGQVRSACCCKRTDAEMHAACVRADDCCEDRVTKADHPPARFELAKQHLQATPMVATLPVMGARMAPTQPADANLPPGARGPPSGASPPLFIWNCSYLI